MSMPRFRAMGPSAKSWFPLMKIILMLLSTLSMILRTSRHSCSVMVPNSCLMSPLMMSVVACVSLSSFCKCSLMSWYWNRGI